MLAKKINSVIFFFILFVFPLHGKANTKIDSLLQLLKTDKADTLQVIHLNTLAAEFKYSNPDTSILFTNKALALLNTEPVKPDFRKQLFIGNSLRLLGIFYYLKGNYPKASEYYFKSLAIWDKLEVSSEQKSKTEIFTFKSRTLGNIGVLYDEQGEYQKALNYYFKALKIDEKVGNKKVIASKLGNIGVAYKNLASALSNSSLNRNKKDSLIQLALKYYFKALKIDEEFKNKANMALWNGNIGALYHDIGKIDLALQYYQKALKLDTELGNTSNIATWLGNIGSSYLDKSNYKEAFHYLFQSLSLSHSTGSMIDIKSQYEHLSKLYEKSTSPLPDTIGGVLLNFEQMRIQSLYYYKRSIGIRDTLFNQENRKQLVQKEMNYEFEKKEAATKAKNDKQKAIAAAENRRQKIIIYFVVFGFLFVLLFAVFILYTLNITRKQKHLIEEQKTLVDEANEELNQQNEEIASQKDEIERQRDLMIVQNKKITDSIEYARFIQQALFTSHEILDQCNIRNFIFFKPKSIISGDFYWFKQIHNYIYFAAADSTGHGVPGAFMSVLGISLLNEIIGKRDLNPPALVLNELRKKLIKSLNQNNPDTITHDGMDISLCLLDMETLNLQFAGAYNPLILVRNNKVFEYLADQMPVGVHPKDKIDFTNHEILLQQNDMLYIASDGYASQFSESNLKKFGNKQFKELLIEINQNSLEMQMQQLETKFKDWQGNYEQIDDVLVLGIKI
jgi:serine phosphatase RsbU (regulator of sigma subunit)